MGRYYTLQATAGWLLKETALTSALADEAEREADAAVDTVLHEFNRAAWPLAVPPDVAAAASKLAASNYLRRRLATVDNGAAPGDASFVAWLETDARAKLEEIAERGWLMDAAGLKLTTEEVNPEASAGLFR